MKEMIAYCARCRMSRKMKDIRKIGYGYKGSCPECKSKMFRTGKKDGG